MLQVVDYVEGFLFRSSIRKLLGVGFLLTVFKSGISDKADARSFSATG